MRERQEISVSVFTCPWPFGTLRQEEEGRYGEGANGDAAGKEEEEPSDEVDLDRLRPR